MSQDWTTGRSSPRKVSRMKKTQFCIGLLSACLISTSSTFLSDAHAQSCGAESCDSPTCKCSKKHCDDTGLLEVINTAASNFEAGLANMIPDGSRLKPKKSCKCKQCSASYEGHESHMHASPIPTIEPPTVYQHEEVPQIPRVAPPNPITTPIPAPHPQTLPDVQSNPFIDEAPGHTRNLRTVPTRPANHLRTSTPSLRYDPQARVNGPMRSILSSAATTKSISDAEYGLATTKSTRRAPTENIGTHINDIAIEVAATESQQPTPEVVPASINTPISRLSPLPVVSEPTAAPLYVNPLRAQ